MSREELRVLATDLEEIASGLASPGWSECPRCCCELEPAKNELSARHVEAAREAAKFIRATLAQQS